MIEIRDLHFRYPGDGRPLFSGLNLSLPRGSRTVLAGANGTGKSTLLRLVAGLHLLPEASVLIGGRSPFHGQPSVRLAEGGFPVHLDIRVQELLDHRIAGASAGPIGKSEIQAELVEILGIDPSWRMHQVSQGQRTRVELLLLLRNPCEVLLMDEIGAHLDVLVRHDLLEWIRMRSESHGLTVIYATHIFEGLSRKPHWPTHLAFLSPGGGCSLDPFDRINQPLNDYCTDRMRAERDGKIFSPQAKRE